MCVFDPVSEIPFEPRARIDDYPGSEEKFGNVKLHDQPASENGDPHLHTTF